MLVVAMKKKDIEKWILTRYKLVHGNYRELKSEKLKEIQVNKLILLEEILYLFQYSTHSTNDHFQLLKKGKVVFEYDF